jgi:hypothetical protein
VPRLCVSSVPQCSASSRHQILLRFSQPSLLIPFWRPHTGSFNRDPGSRTAVSQDFRPSSAPFPSPEMSVSMPQIPENSCNTKRTSLPPSAQPYDIPVFTIGPKWTRAIEPTQTHQTHRVSAMSVIFPPTTRCFWCSRGVLQGQRGAGPTLGVDPLWTSSKGPHTTG